MSTLFTDDLPPKFESAATAERWRNALVRHLDNDGSRDALDLKTLIEVCRSEGRCWSYACPICNRLWRKQFILGNLPILRQRPYWMVASVVPAGGLLRMGELADFDLTRYVRTNQRRLQRSLSREVLVIGGVDFSFNVDENQDVGWQAHLYLLISVLIDEAIKDVIREAFPPEPSAARPYKFRTLLDRPSDRAGALSYVHKNRFVRRSGYIGSNGRRETADQDLRPAQAVEAAVFLDRYVLGDRLILKGIRRSGALLSVMEPVAERASEMAR